MSALPQFGHQEPAQSDILRPGAYAVLSRTDGCIAVLQVGERFFLPGGGLEDGETPRQALRREMLEETGCAVHIGREIGRAEEVLQAHGKRCLIQGRFFSARLGRQKAQPIETDHQLIWLEAQAALQKLHSPGQAWAVQIWLENPLSCLPSTHWHPSRLDPVRQLSIHPSTP